jgi:hypothetical protein
MKKIFSLILVLLAFSLLFSGCGYRLVRGNGPSSETDSPERTEAPVETDNTEETAPLPDIAVNLTEEEQEYKSDEGQMLLSFSAQSAAISYPDNTAVEEAINASLAAAYDTFCSYRDEYVSAASEQLSEMGSEYWNEYMMVREVAAGRLDRRIASITYCDYYYLGGAHGSTVITAQNYDMTTGRLLTLSDLAADRQAFMDFTLKYLLWLTLKPGFSDLYPWATEDALKMIIAEGFWCLNETGLEFICNEYSIGPYAAGITSLIIPYKDLEGVILDKWLPEIN